jgi:hypothetical protein
MLGTLVAAPESCLTDRLRSDPSTRCAKLRVNLTYLWRHARLPDLVEPRLFTEFVQTRKLYDRRASHRPLMDKLAAKALARRVLGMDWTIPTLWAGAHLPDATPFPMPAILKARHGCNQYAVLRERPGAWQWQALQKRSAQWLQKPYGVLLDEWAYRDLARGLLAEPLLGDGADLPIDYKVYVFGGRATHVQVHLGRGRNHRWILHDRDWRQLVPMPDRPPAPRSLPAMLDAAQALAAGTDFLRVDFYEIAGKPLFGEFCLYPGSGLDRFAAPWIDHELGCLWRAARAGMRHVQDMA